MYNTKLYCKITYSVNILPKPLIKSTTMRWSTQSIEWTLNNDHHVNLYRYACGTYWWLPDEWYCLQRMLKHSMVHCNLVSIPCLKSLHDKCQWMRHNYMLGSGHRYSMIPKGYEWHPEPEQSLMILVKTFANIVATEIMAIGACVTKSKYHDGTTFDYLFFLSSVLCLEP